MKGFLFSVVVLADLLFRFITPIPRGDTDVNCVNIKRFHGENSVLLDKVLEVYRSDCGSIYYNLFYSEIASDSTIMIYKARIRLPKTFHFTYGIQGIGGNTIYCFDNKKEWFVLLFNDSNGEDSCFEKDSCGIIIYSEKEILEEKWQRYDNSAKNVVFNEVDRRHPKNPWFYLEKKSVYGLFKQKNNVLYFDVKSKHEKLGEALFSNFEIIDKRSIPNVQLPKRE